MIRKLLLSLSLLGATAIAPMAASAQWHDAQPTASRGAASARWRDAQPAVQLQHRGRFQAPRAISLRERAALNRAERQIARLEAMALADGRVSRREARQIAMARMEHQRLLARFSRNGRFGFNGGFGR